MIGRKLSHYHINERIGEGGMGTVYKATDMSLKRTVAIKMLHPNLVNNPDSFKRFQNEAHLSAQISHPNVATLFDFQESDNSHFIVMEYVNGKAVDDVLKLQGHLSDDESIKIILQVLEGLGAAHELGIMHRDLKPGNIMITQRGFVKLMDFGIARLENTERMTRQNSVIGTLDYLSPELIKGAAPSKASDLYAVGVMLYEMLSGQPLHAGDSEAALMYQIAHKQPAIHLAGHDKRLVQIIKKLTHKQVAKRYQSTQEVIRDLERIHAGGKVNTVLLEKKLEPQQRQSKTALALPFKFTMPQLSAIKDIQLPFDIDLRILAGALVVCLLIFMAGLWNSSDATEIPEGPTIAENGEITNPGDIEQDPANNYQVNPQRTHEPARGEIEFIERFDETTVSPGQEKSTATTRKTEQGQEKRKSPKNESPKAREQVRETAAEVKKKDQDVIQQRPEEPKLVNTQPSDKIIETDPNNTITDFSAQDNEKKATRSVTVRIPDMYLSASLSEFVSTEKNREGQSVYLHTSSAIYQGDHLIIRKGAKVRAVVKKLRKAEGRKKAFLAIQLLSVQAVNGNWLTISYPEYSNLSKTVVEFRQGLRLDKIKLKSTNITL